MSAEAELGRPPWPEENSPPPHGQTALAPDRPQPRMSSRRPRWQVRYARVVAAMDLLSIAASSALYLLWGSATAEFTLSTGAGVVALTGACLYVARAWDPSVLGQEHTEFTRLLRGMLVAAVTVGLFSLAAQLPAGRPWVFGVIPIAGIFAATARGVLRIGLHRRRRGGAAMARVLAIGSAESVSGLVTRMRKAPEYGWTVVGACTPTGTGPDGEPSVDGVTVFGDLDSASRLARSGHFDAVSVGQTPGWSARRLQQLAWDLEGTGTELIVDPGLMDVTGPRLHMATVDGLPLLRLTHPTFDGGPRLLKGVLDRIGAGLVLLLLLPVMLGLAVAVRSDGGPVLFRQRRVGRDGREFSMLKFRTMVVDAEERLADLVAGNDGAGPMFKMRDDPRVTRVGAVLRRYSIDELPQLLNVLGGSMSLVGPRPPLPREVIGYARDARRRLLVKPGMTGLWQVSGRSDLSWDETVRLDLRYVENWTLALDAQILIRTVRAVFSGGGAY